MKMKKALSVLLMLSMLVGVFSVTVSARDQDWRIDDTFTLGDVNGDGYVDAVDAFDVVRYLADVEGASLDRNAADMDADGDITTADSLQFRLCLAEVKQWSDYEITDDYGEALYNFTILHCCACRYKTVQQPVFCGGSAAEICSHGNRP